MAYFLTAPKRLESGMAVVCFILAILPIPGLGIIIYNLTAKDDKWVNAIVPLVLGITGIFWIVGAILGGVDGYRIYKAAQSNTA